MSLVGNLAPNFSLLDQYGATHDLEKYSGQWVVLYAYPKDDTPGCTKQACAMQMALSEFESRNAVVLGISADSIESHEKFANKHDVNFPLLADTSKEVLTAYGAFKEKSMFGKIGFGIVRTTYIIDPTGKIAHVFEKVSPDKNTKQVLDTLDALQK